MRPHHLLVVLPLLWMGGCQPLEEPPAEVTVDYELVALDSLPMEWGRLVAVTPHVDRTGFSQWYELWFSEPTTGRITMVPMYRPGLTYPPSLVVAIERASAAQETVSAEPAS